MQTSIYILTVIFMTFIILVFLGHFGYQTPYKGFRKGPKEQNRDHTLQNGI